MSLEIEERDRDGLAVLACKGRLVLGTESSDFREKTRELLKQGKCNIILNMAQVDHIDSSGLGELISLNKDVQSAGGNLKIVELNQKNADLMVITKLTTVFKLFDDEQDAVNNFFPQRQISTFDLLEFVQDIKGDGAEAEMNDLKKENKKDA